MAQLTEQEYAAIAAWQVGVGDEVPVEILAKLEPADEEQTLEIGKAVMAASRAYRREHGAWPTRVGVTEDEAADGGAA